MEKGILLLEHVNLRIPEPATDTTTAASFYLKVLAGKRDPRSTRSVHVNLGITQFHITVGLDEPSQIIDGHIGLVYPDLQLVLNRLKDTQLSYELVRGGFDLQLESWPSMCLENSSHINVTGPHGNKFKIFKTPQGYKELVSDFGALPTAPSEGDGMIYLQIKVRPGHAHGIARFYSTYFVATCSVVKAKDDDTLNKCIVSCNGLQYLIFEEVDGRIAEYDGYHICLYISDFKGAFDRIQNAKLNWNNPRFTDQCDTWEQVHSQNQFRTLKITDPRTNEHLLNLEHEIRNVDHCRCPIGKTVEDYAT